MSKTGRKKVQKGTMKKITCPNPRCHTKVSVIIGNKNNGEGENWSGTKEIQCTNPKCGRMIKFRVNERGKVKLVI